MTDRLLHKRREFIALLGGAAATWPLAARGQQREQLRRLGVLMNTTADDPEAQSRITAFVQELRQLGWIVDRNVRIDYVQHVCSAMIRASEWIDQPAP